MILSIAPFVYLLRQFMNAFLIFLPLLMDEWMLMRLVFVEPELLQEMSEATPEAASASVTKGENHLTERHAKNHRDY